MDGVDISAEDARQAKKARMYDSDQDAAPAPASTSAPANVVASPSINTSALRSVLKGALLKQKRLNYTTCTEHVVAAALTELIASCSVRGASGAELRAALVRCTSSRTAQQQPARL